jgi:catechol 2,3-dioxygenase-like lactoylglutathione lyase family enzyme
MPINNALAGIAVKDFSTARAWYEQLLGRAPDAEPMKGRLVEWHFPEGGVLLVFEEKDRAGRGSVTLSVTSLEEQLADLKAKGIVIGQQTQTEFILTATVSDPDGNLITFAESLTETT